MKKDTSDSSTAAARLPDAARPTGRRPRRARSISPQRRSSSGAGPTPNAILDAALRIFARDGFDGASIPAIAKAASIGHPLVHYHFGSKENLWRAVVDYAFSDLARSMAVLEDAADGLAPVDALRLLCRGFAQFTARNPLHTMILYNELRTGGERLDWLVERYLRPPHERLDRVIAAAVATGAIRPVPAAHLSSIAIGATVHFFSAAPLVARLYDVDVHDPDVIETHSQWVLEILMNGLIVTPPANASPKDGSTAPGNRADPGPSPRRIEP